MSTYVNASEIRIHPEPTPPAVDPHRSARRGLGIIWKNGAHSEPSTARYVYATWVAPDNISNGKIRGIFKKWSGNDTSITTKSYVDVLDVSDPLPENTINGQEKAISGLDSNARMYDIVTGINANKGDSILLAFFVKNLSTDTEIGLHALWLEY